jgi:hypothetical protein
MKILNINKEPSESTNSEESANRKKRSLELETPSKISIETLNIENLDNLKQATLDLFRSSNRLIQFFHFRLIKEFEAIEKLS